MASFSDYLIQQGYKKKSNTYYKLVNDGIYLFFKIVKSQFSENKIVDIGIFFPIVKETDFKITSCQLETRLNNIIPESLNWSTEFENFGDDLQKMFQDKVESELNLISNKDYLKNNFPDHFDHDRWWLAYITKKQFIEYLNKL